MQHWKKKFILLWTGQAVSILTSSVLQMAIVWYLTQKTGSAAVLSLATLVGYLPQAVLGTFIGVYVDRYPRKILMVASDLLIAAAGLFLVLLSGGHDIPTWMILVVLFVRSVGTAFHQPSLQAVMPLLVPKENLVQCVGFSQSFESVAMVASPALAGILFGFFRLNAIILLDAAGAVFAVVLLCFVPIPHHVRVASQRTLPLLAGVKEGLSILRKKEGLTALLLISALYAVIYFPIGTLYPLITMRYFGGTVAQSGVVEIIFSGGMLLGSLCLGVLGGKIKKSRAMAASMFFYGFCLALEGLLPPSGLFAFSLLTAFLGLSVPFYTGIETAILQSKIEDEYRGRILSLSSSMTMLAMPLGLVLSGLFAGRLGVNRWFFFSGIAALLLALLLVSIPAIRRCCDSEL